MAWKVQWRNCSFTPVLRLNGTGQFTIHNAVSHHNITGDTIELGNKSSGEGQYFLHSKLTVNGLTDFPVNPVFNGSANDADYIIGELYRKVTDPQKMFLSYLLPGEDKYRYYWNKDVPFGADITVNHADLLQMSALKNIQMPNGITTDYFYVAGKPNEAGEQFHLTKAGAATVFLPWCG